MASINQFYSQNLAAEVIKGTTEKARHGGTPGRPQIGYINDRVVVDGREIRMVSVDQERGPFITAAFQLYATGDYALPELAAILEERGFRNRARRGQPTVPVAPNRLSDILRSDYYIGVVRYRDVVAKGRHPKLTDEATFQRVQEILSARKIAGERSWRHLHYLRGSIYCGECGSRLMYTRATGRRGGTYEYFVCCAKRLGKCDQPYQRAEAIEAAVEREYHRVRLSDAQRAKIRSDVHAHAAGIDAQAEPERRQAEQTLLKLQAQEKKLLQAHYEDGISPELFAEEQRRIRRERVAAETRLTALEADHGLVLGNLDTALELTDRIEEAYHRADPTVRRLLNQAIFERIWIEREQISERRIASPIREVLDQNSGVAGFADAAEVDGARDEATPTALFSGGGCDFEGMVRLTGAVSNPQLEQRVRQAAKLRKALLRNQPPELPPSLPLPVANGAYRTEALDVLRAATEPMTPKQVQREVSKAMDIPVAYVTIATFLSRTARREGSAIIRVGKGLYELDKTNERTCPT